MDRSLGREDGQDLLNFYAGRVSLVRPLWQRAKRQGPSTRSGTRRR